MTYKVSSKIKSCVREEIEVRICATVKKKKSSIKEIKRAPEVAPRGVALLIYASSLTVRGGGGR